MMRPGTSAAPPAEKGPIQRTARFGYPCECATPAAANIVSPTNLRTGTSGFHCYSDEVEIDDSDAMLQCQASENRSMVRLLSGPGIVHIIVCGDPNRNQVMTLEDGHADPATQAIVLPANWDQLVREAV